MFISSADFLNEFITFHSLSGCLLFCFVICSCILEAFIAISVDPDQTAPIRLVSIGSSQIWIHTLCYRGLQNTIAEDNADNFSLIYCLKSYSTAFSFFWLAVIILDCWYKKLIYASQTLNQVLSSILLILRHRLITGDP